MAPLPPGQSGRVGVGDKQAFVVRGGISGNVSPHFVRSWFSRIIIRQVVVRHS
jgi:hypothetical protein